MDNKKKETSIVKKMILAVAGGFMSAFERVLEWKWQQRGLECD